MPASRLSVRQHPEFGRTMGFLGSGYVFYDRLITDAEEHQAPDLADLWYKMNDSIIQIAYGESGRENKKRVRSEAAAQLRQMAANEKAKEQMIIKSQLGIDIDYDLSDKGSVKDFLESLAACIGLREHHLRNVERITKYNQKMVSISKFIVSYDKTGYFDKTVRNIFRGKRFKEDLRACVESGDEYGIRDTLTKGFSGALTNTIKKMLTSKTFKDQVSQFDNAYLEVLQQINSDADYRNAFRGTLSEMLQIEARIDKITNNLLEIGDLDEIGSALAKGINIETKGLGKIQGEMEELLLEAIVNAFSGMTTTTRDGDMSVKIQPEAGKRGQHGQKTDVYITVGVDMATIDSSFSQGEVSRQKAIDDARDLSAKLRKFNDGFVVHENAKNYTLDGGWFKTEGGFSAGAFSGEGGLNFLRDLYKRVGKSTEARQVFNGIKNLGKDTIGEGDDQLEQLLEDALGADVAYALFDDYDSLGVVANTGAQQLHVLDLDGVQITLSFYLSLLAQAFERMANNLEETAEDLVKVDIKPAPAIYADLPFYRYGVFRDMGINLWARQKSYSDENSLIDVHFFKSFSQVVKEYLGDLQ